MKRKNNLKRDATGKRYPTRNSVSFVKHTHYNEKDKLLCHTWSLEPKHTKNKKEVTCTHCLRELGRIIK